MSTLKQLNEFWENEVKTKRPTALAGHLKAALPSHTKTTEVSGTADNRRMWINNPSKTNPSFDELHSHLKNTFGGDKVSKDYADTEHHVDVGTHKLIISHQGNGQMHIQALKKSKSNAATISRRNAGFDV